MTAQLALPLRSSLRYLPKQFVMHAGVREAYAGCIATLRSQQFRICCIVGATRSGRTHFAVRLADQLRSDFDVSLIDSSGLQRLISSSDISFGSNSLIIVDDIDEYLNTLREGDSGPFVRLLEELRLRRVKIVLMLKKAPSEYQFDEHVLSRLNAGAGFSIKAPAASDLADVLLVLARQRGIELDQRKLKFLGRRLRHDIAALEGYLDRLSHLSSIIGGPIKLSLMNTAV